MLAFETDSIDSLDDPIKALYEQDGDKWRLKVEGLPKPDNGDLMTRLEKLEANNKALLDEKRKAREEAERVKLDAAKKGGDVEALEKSWADKLAAREAELMGQIEESAKMVSGLTVGQTSTSLAAELFGENADLMKHHIDSRLTYEVADGKAKVRVLKDGQPSALTLDDLKKEFMANQRFAPFLVGSKASGPGAHGKGSSGPNTMSRKDFEAMSPAAKVEFSKKGGTLF